MLTAKKKAFIEQYKIDRNGARAARAAGYSPKFAGTNAYHIKQDKDVSAAIKAWEDEEQAKAREEAAKRRKFPTKQSYIERTFTNFDEAKDAGNWGSAARFWELGGKACDYLEPAQKDTGPIVFNLIKSITLVNRQADNGVLPDLTQKITNQNADNITQPIDTVGHVEK